MPDPHLVNVGYKLRGWKEGADWVSLQDLAEENNIDTLYTALLEVEFALNVMHEDDVFNGSLDYNTIMFSELAHQVVFL